MGIFELVHKLLLISSFPLPFYLQVWHLADVPKNDEFQYTHFAHKINSFDTAPRKLLASDSRLRPDRYALERGDLSKAGAEKSRYQLIVTYIFFFSRFSFFFIFKILFK